MQAGAISNAVVLEECIMQKGEPADAGSKMLENFIAPFDAEVVVRLRDNGFSIAGRAQMDEFAFGRITKGKDDSLSQAVQFILEGKAKFALCNDLFGKLRSQTAENELCYIHPSYGTVSRYGLIQSVCSMDQIGVACKDVAEGFELLSAIVGSDQKDGAMFPEGRYKYSETNKSLRVGIPSNVLNQAGVDARESITKVSEKFKIIDTDLMYFEMYKQVFYILACAELANNTNRYDGVKFGYRAKDFKGVNDMYIKSRTEALGLEVKLAAIMGGHVLSREHYAPLYEKAMKLRGMIKRSIKFDEYDIVALPLSIGDDPYENLALHALAPLAGLPCISFSYKGQGVQLLANVKCENDLLTAWKVVQS